MKNIFNILFRIACVALIGVAVAGCLKDANLDYKPDNGGGNDGAKEEISILLSVPGSETPATRSMDGVGENKVTHIDVLVFAVSGTTETFAYYQKGTEVSNVVPDTPTGAYKAKFKVNLMVEANRKIVVVANARGLIDNLFDGNSANGEITDGMSKSAVLELLTLTNASKWNAVNDTYTVVPMYGETPNAVTIKAGDNFDMGLTRMLARVDIHNETGSGFSISKVYLAKPMTNGYIAPVWNTNGKTAQGAATAPNIKSTWTNATGSFVYDMSSVTTGITGMQQSYEGEIYTFETRAASGDGESDATRLGATCLIVEGVYNGATYFYRVDFTYDGTEGTTKGAYMPLLRNYKYQVIVEAAEGIGYASYNEALNSYTVKSNLRTRVIHYDESVITNVVSNGQYMLGVEHTEMRLDWTGMPLTNFIVTDYDYTYSSANDPTVHENGWRITGYSTDGDEANLTTAAPDWFFYPAEKEITGATKCNLTVSATMNVTVDNVNEDINFSPSSVRTAYIHIQAGRLKQVVKVTQGVHTQLINMPRQYPNSYMVAPGGTVLIPTLKPWLVWHAGTAAGGVAEPLDPNAAVTCEIVWQDTQNLIAELLLAGGDQGAHSQLYVRPTPGKEGNAVVAVKVGGVIVWSYHIWVTAYEPGNGVGTKKLMDRNMGALMTSWASYSPPGALITNPSLYMNTANTVMGCYYQFGRKDPFYPRPVYGKAKTVEPGNTLEQSITVPNKYINDWTSPVGANAWKTGNTATPKTIHDPCPLGWRVPEAGIWGNGIGGGSGSSAGPWSAYANGGRTFDGGFYPFSGTMTPDGVITNSTDDAYGIGYCHTSTRFIFLANSWNYISPVHEPGESYLSLRAQSVRCVKDEGQSGGGSSITPDPVPSGYTFYVGAFWKADQVGERLIKMAAPAGDWTATVIEGADWVKLDQRPSEDPAIWTDNPAPMLTAAEDRAYQVAGTTATTVTGTVPADGDNIYFRIGLKSTLASATTAPRYGVVLLTYENNTKYHKIYLRQGEEPDYLMRTTDNNAFGTITTQWGGTAANPRPDAKKMFPYNLTHPTFKANAVASPTGISAPIRATSNAENYFTTYPTQAGALYQYSPSYGVYAFHPAAPIAAAPANWQEGYSSSYWNSIVSATETCPYGYRRLSDGTHATNSTGSIVASETRQSLWHNPVAGEGGGGTGNSVWGYYADGFFDRRKLATQAASTGAGNNSAVATGTSHVAYMGRLFYNPNNSASIFFPAAGFRGNGSFGGHLCSPGSYGFYWSSSAISTTYGWALNLNHEVAHAGSNTRNVGFPIRCMKP